MIFPEGNGFRTSHLISRKKRGIVKLSISHLAQPGSALVMVIILVFAIMIRVPLGANLIYESFRDSKRQLDTLGQAKNVPRAGLTDAIACLKKQQSQPVKTGVPPVKHGWVDGAFDPRFSTDTVLCDTFDESIGMVKEYALSESGNRWARYEVKRQTNPAISAWNPHAVHDITSQRLYSGEQNGQGLVWYIESAGYIYRKLDPGVAYNVTPNQMVSKAKVSTEIKRISLNLPAQCACIVNNGGGSAAADRKIKIQKNGRVIGGNSIGIGRNKGYEPYLYTGSTVTGNPRWQVVTDTPSVVYVFGVSTSDIKGMADYVVTGVTQLPNPMPDMSIIYIDGDAVFTSACPLRSSGILFVHGDLTVSDNSNSLYSGLIYVTGTATVYDPALLSGCLIAYSGLNLARSASTDVAEIDYDASILSSVRQQLCQ